MPLSVLSVIAPSVTDTTADDTVCWKITSAQV